jgi:hypothetical protein
MAAVSFIEHKREGPLELTPFERAFSIALAELVVRPQAEIKSALPNRQRTRVVLSFWPCNCDYAISVSRTLLSAIGFS